MRRLYFFTLFIIAISQTMAVSLGEIRFNNEMSDTIRINSLLSDASGLNSSAERIVHIAKQFIGTPYVAGTLECPQEMLTINLDGLDCTTFVETVLALAYTANERRFSWRDFVYNLERIRYRSGQLNGYASRLHYISDWIADNSHRGNFKEISANFTNHSYQIKSLDFMSKNRDKYSALTDSIEFERIKNIEFGYRNHRFPYIKKENLRKKETLKTFREGDIVALTSNINGLDVSHMGIVIFIDNSPHLLHASSSKGKVTIENMPIYETLMTNRRNTGIRVIRLE